jgi:O-antigen ligase
MTAGAMTVADTRPAFALDRVALWLLLGFVAALQVSIAAAGILLTALLLSWAALLVRDRVRPSAPRFFLPLAAFGAATLISAALSIDPRTSLVDTKQLLLFLIVPAVYSVARGPRASLVVDVIVTVGAASAAYGIIQYSVLHFDNLGQRPQGALGHYMTYSGVLMLVLCTAVARLVFGARDRLWPGLVLPALVVALSLTFTRSAWVGACVAVSLLFMLKDFRLTALIPVVIALLFALAPDGVTDRMMSVFDLRDPSNRDRLAMVRTGNAIVRDFPLTGVGPNMVPRVYPQYRDAQAVQAVNPHLHNVPLQIAAERGLPALGVWAWFVVVLVITLVGLFRRPPSTTSPDSGENQGRMLSATALAAVSAMLAAGFFEYNFGDSEFLMMFLVIVTLPFAYAHGIQNPK